MMDTVPAKSRYDYGANYLRVFSTFIPRLIWPDKPLFGRPAWIDAWIAGSEIEREEDFSGPAIGLLGATQLNGGSTATRDRAGLHRPGLSRGRMSTFVVMQTFPGCSSGGRSSYYNAWFMVVCDDPLAWFYLNWGFTTSPSWC